MSLDRKDLQAIEEVMSILSDVDRSKIGHDTVGKLRDAIKKLVVKTKVRRWAE